MKESMILEFKYTNDEDVTYAIKIHGDEIYGNELGEVTYELNNKTLNDLIQSLINLKGEK